MLIYIQALQQIVNIEKSPRQLRTLSVGGMKHKQPVNILPTCANFTIENITLEISELQH